MPNISIVPMKPDEGGDAAELLARAFIRTPFTGFVAGGEGPGALRNLRYGFMSMVTKKPGTVVVARDGDELVGVMRTVKWPDCQNSAPRGAEWMMPLLFAPGPATRLRAFRKVWARHDPKLSHWHIDPLGVSPGRQGQGIGSGLLTHFCERVDMEGLPAYFETDQEQNVRLYERFGFRVLEEEPVFGFTHWFLWRDANGR